MIANPDRTVQADIDNGKVKITTLTVVCLSLLSILAAIYVWILYKYGIRRSGQSVVSSNSNSKEVALTELTARASSPVSETSSNSTRPVEMINALQKEMTR